MLKTRAAASCALLCIRPQHENNGKQNILLFIKNFIGENIIQKLRNQEYIRRQK